MWDLIKSKIFVEEPTKPQGATPAATGPAPELGRAAPAVQGDQGNTSVSAPPEIAGAQSGLDVSLLEKRLDGLIRADAGFAPCAAFLDMRENMRSAFVNEADQFRAALVGTKTAVEVLLESANASSTVLAQEADNFERTFVAEGEAAIHSLTTQSEEVNEQITALTQQVAALNEKRSGLVADASAKTANLAKAKIDFASVSTMLASRYQELAQKMKQHLGA